MEIGDIVLNGGKRYSVRGFDPTGAEPRRFVYLENVETGEMISITFAELAAARPSAALLRLVEDKKLS
jgi:hypothetical protein